MPKKPAKSSPKKALIAHPRVTTALARAERGSAPVKLTRDENHLLQRAINEGKKLKSAVEEATLEFGRWVVTEIFDGNAIAALDERSTNPVWSELLRRASGKSLGLNRRLISVAVRIAANDQRITDGAWRSLDVGRKEVLLPLDSEPRLREAAKHVVAFDLPPSETHAYVTALMAEDGKKRQVRLTRAGLASRAKRAHSLFGGAGFVSRASELVAGMNAKQHAAILRQLEEVRTDVDRLLRAIKAAAR